MITMLEWTQNNTQQNIGHYRLPPVDDSDEGVIRNNVQEFYTHRHQLPIINNLLSVFKTDFMSTIHQNKINKKQYDHNSKRI